jgi:hypothetical protein
VKGFADARQRTCEDIGGFGSDGSGHFMEGKIQEMAFLTLKHYMRIRPSENDFVMHFTCCVL